MWKILQKKTPKTLKTPQKPTKNLPKKNQQKKKEWKIIHPREKTMKYIQDFHYSEDK